MNFVEIGQGIELFDINVVLYAVSIVAFVSSAVAKRRVAACHRDAMKIYEQSGTTVQSEPHTVFYFVNNFMVNCKT